MFYLRYLCLFGSSLPPLFVGGLIFYLRYLCLFAHIVVSNIYCVVLLLLFLSLVLPVSLDSPCLIAHSLFPSVYFHGHMWSPVVYFYVQ